MVITTGPVPDGATSVVQIATGGMARMRSLAHARSTGARVSTNCSIAQRATARSYTCRARLGAGTWALTTEARAGRQVIASASRRVTIAPVRRAAVTG